MKIEYFCPYWGSEKLGWNLFLKNAKTAGYNGVEAGLPFDGSEKNEIVKKIKDQGLTLIGQHFETLESDFVKHKDLFQNHLYNLAEAQPLFINSQTGKDYYSQSQNAELFEIAARISKETSIKIIHETHRGKWSFAAHITKTYLEKYPELRLCLDISHWCNTAESFLHDQQEAVALAIKHTDHIHARVGYPEGPQVTDPRAPENKQALDIHLHWWKQVVAECKAQGKKSLTISPEFGAPPYLVLKPHTQEPIANQWDMNLFMMEFLKSSL